MPTPPSPTVLISGASIAGPALAHRLGHHGFRPTVVELAPALREGGHAVDFRGDTHLTVLRRMGLLDALRRLQTGGSPMTLVDQDDTPLLHLPAAFAGGDIEVLRGDLSRTLYEASLPTTEYVFGDSVTGLTETPDGVDVTFRRSPPRTFDLVIGADGIHSHIRRLAFGPEERHITHLGYYAATWSLPHHPHPDLRPGSVGYNAPGRLAGVGTGHANPARAGAFFLFASPELTYDRHDPDAQKALLEAAFAGLPWRVRELLLDRQAVPEGWGPYGPLPRPRHRPRPAPAPARRHVRPHARHGLDAEAGPEAGRPEKPPAAGRPGPDALTALTIGAPRSTSRR
ncbi:FAD-dependent monooxygenase [Streptomyces goshikiensis]|uniref:FAD-dependent monooxygenase n=1 Tax=Streptomyces goshikiensis TaxID=1942 RepID=UPI0036C25D99